VIFGANDIAENDTLAFRILGRGDGKLKFAAAKANPCNPEA